VKASFAALIFTDMAQIDFYTYTGRNNTVNKVLGAAYSITGQLRSETDFINPFVIVRVANFAYNYCYIPELGRYYFIENIEELGEARVRLYLRCDVLKTYEAAIMAAGATTKESEQPNPYISNRTSVYNRKPNFEKVAFPNTGLLNEEGTIIMVTLKGSEN
jgi:hypothetical protein